MRTAASISDIRRRTTDYLCSWWAECPVPYRWLLAACIILWCCGDVHAAPAVPSSSSSSLRGSKTTSPSAVAPAVTPPSPLVERGAGGVRWVHPALPTASTDPWVAKRLNWAISNDVPIRTWPMTSYWPGEPSGMGGGWGTAGDADQVHVGIIASSVAYWRFWRGHELWIEGYNPRYSGFARVADNGPGWSSKNRFDLAAGSVAAVLAWEKGTEHGYRVVRCMVIGCPHPAACTCDYAVCFRAAQARAKTASNPPVVVPAVAPLTIKPAG